MIVQLYRYRRTPAGDGWYAGPAACLRSSEALMWLLALVWSAALTVPSATLAQASPENISGVVATAKATGMSLRVPGRSRTYVFDRKTTLVDRDGHVLASGGKAIAARVRAGTTVRILYKMEWVTGAEGWVNAVYYRVIELRLLSEDR
jgi:hypothetical protein